MGLRLVRGSLTILRRATADDAELLVRWHADPEVFRYWDDETFTLDEMHERLSRPDVDLFIVEADGEPAGFIEACWEEDPPLRGGVDMVFAPGARGRGLGPDAARALARHPLEERAGRA